MLRPTTFLGGLWLDCIEQFTIFDREFCRFPVVGKENQTTTQGATLAYLVYTTRNSAQKRERKKERKKEKKMDRWHEKYHQTVVIEAYHQALNKICQDFCTWKVRTTSLS